MKHIAPQKRKVKDNYYEKQEERPDYCRPDEKKRRRNECVFLSNFRYKKETFDFFWATFSEITGNFPGNLEQLVKSASLRGVVWLSN